MTTNVEASSSWRLDQATLLNSCLTSFRKLAVFLKMFTRITSGAAGLEPAVTVLETVGLPLTDAPILNLFCFFVRGMSLTGPTEFLYL